MIQSLPAYSAGAAKSILNSVVASVQDDIRRIIENNRNESEPLSSRSYKMFVEASKMALEAGLGTGIIIVSGMSKEDPEVDALDKQISTLVTLIEGIRSTILKVPRIDPTTKSVDVRVEIPNWGKTIGATLPTWNDAKSREDLVGLIINQIRTDIQILREFKSSTSMISPMQAANVATVDLQMEFMLGLMAAFVYSKPSDLKSMSLKFEMKGGQADVMQYYNILDKILHPADPAQAKLNITGDIASLVAESAASRGK